MNANEQRDPVKEARELLAKVTLPAEMNAHSRELLPALCDELDEARAELKERRKEVLDLEDEVSKNHA